MTPEMLIYIAYDDMDNTMTPQMLLLHIPSLKLTVRIWKLAETQEEMTSSNHPFSGDDLLVSGRVYHVNIPD